MKPPVDTVRVSQRGKEILIKLKRNTGIEQWNVLCRWALCASLQRESRPPSFNNNEESNIEMTWRTFAGQHTDLLAALVKQRATLDGVDPNCTDAVARYFRSHIERGIATIQNTKGISSLLLNRVY